MSESCVFFNEIQCLFVMKTKVYISRTGLPELENNQKIHLNACLQLLK